MSIPAPSSTPPLHWFKDHGLLIILLAAYLLMGLLIVEQGRTIASQANLIRQLFGDSLELNAMKMKQFRDRQTEQRR